MRDDGGRVITEYRWKVRQKGLVYTETDEENETDRR